MEMEKIIVSYYENNAKKLHAMIDKILFKLKFNVDNDDFYSLGNEIFLDVINRYNGKQSFEGFLYSCLIKKFKTEMTRRNRYKRQADRFSISIDTPIGEDNFTISDLLASDLLTENQKRDTVRDIIEEQKDPSLNIYPNTNDEKPMEYDPADFTNDVWFNVFYYNELIPKEYVQPGTTQYSKEYLADVYKTISDAYVQEPNEEGQPGILCLDPDIFIEAKHESVVYTVGHLEDELSEGYFYKQVVIPDDILE